MCRVESKSMHRCVCVYAFECVYGSGCLEFIGVLPFSLTSFPTLILFSGLFGEWREKSRRDVADWNADFFNPSFTFFEYVNLMLGV